MTEARTVLILLSGEIHTSPWADHTNDDLTNIRDNTGAILADDAGSFMITIDENTTVFVASRRIKFIRLETR